jgi:glutamyl-tRNA synthetase
MTVRVRFAPSPTGYLHVGGGRSALYNWLFARSRGGTFVLRSDDTDAQRSTDEFRDDIVDSLRWLGVDWEEGIEVGGSHPSYRQSERTERYQQVVARLLADGAAYHSFETSEQLDEFRRNAQAQGLPPAYDGRFRISAEDAAARLAGGEPAPVRFAVPRPGSTVFDDVVRGEVAFDHSQVDDFVILRSNGTPTYHLASTVDDVDFGITHVVRGEDILSSTPKHILLTEAMGAAVPAYAHLSLLLGPDGSKLSKRHGHTAIRAYRDAGFLPEALRNYLVILGWSPGEDEEIIPVADMVSRFDLEAVSRNPAVFDVTKLEWMNGVYIRELSVDEFVDRTVGLVEEDLDRPLTTDERAMFEKIAPLVQERAKVLTEVPGQVRFIFTTITYDDKSWQKVMTKPDAKPAVERANAALSALNRWESAAIETACRSVVAELEIGAGKVFQPLRVAVTGSSISPPLFESMEALGRDKSLQRLVQALERLQEAPATGEPEAGSR